MSVFLSTPSARRATQGLEQYNRHNQNFYPRPLRGGRPSATAKYTASKNFYPRPLRGGRLLLVFEQAGLFVISIHALCEEGDVVLIGQFAGGVISIHALCEEGDCPDLLSWKSYMKFLSTPSARRATTCTASRWTVASYFYPRPLRGGRPTLRTNALTTLISIHALCEEGDPQHRHRCRGNRISIHALCEEGDQRRCPGRRRPFLSTPSARRATSVPAAGARRLKFLSTPSARRATCRPSRLRIM